jgi:hypothetical protein
MRKSLEAIGLAALALQLWVTYRSLSGPDRLPARIPTHFDAAGNPNAWGSPSVLLFLTIIAVGLYVALTMVARFPAGFNYPVQVTEENRMRLQGITLDMLAWLKAELACLFAVLQWGMLQAARSSEGRLPRLVLPGFLAVLFATVGWHFVAILRAAHSART